MSNARRHRTLGFALWLTVLTSCYSSDGCEPAELSGLFGKGTLARDCAANVEYRGIEYWLGGQ